MESPQSIGIKFDEYSASAGATRPARRLGHALAKNGKTGGKETTANLLHWAACRRLFTPALFTIR
jgi:hypothetical protein